MTEDFTTKNTEREKEMKGFEVNQVKSVSLLYMGKG